MDVDRYMRAAEKYVQRNWYVFVLSAGKIPLRNCARCQPGAGCPGQDACRCGTIGCHGFWSATQNMDHIRALLWRAGEGGGLAVRTGSASGIVVVDAEGTDDDGYGATGVEVIDEIEQWTEGLSLPDTLRARSAGGGVHLFYALPPGVVAAGRGRRLPNVDVKGDGGYVAVPPAKGRGWHDWSAKMEEPGDALLAWLCGTSHRAGSGGVGGSTAGSGNGAGILSALRTADVIPSGQRYEFTRDLVYHLRRNGHGYDEALRVCRGYWDRYAQPPAARWELPWSQVVYELDRVWARVAPEAPLSFARQAWADSIRTSNNNSKR